MPRGLITATALREDQAIELEGELPPPPQFNLRVFFLIFELMPANAGDIKELVKELVIYALVRYMLGRSRPSAGTREECGQPPQLCLTGLHSPYQPSPISQLSPSVRGLLGDRGPNSTPVFCCSATKCARNV